MKIFELDNEIKTYTYPILKIIISVVIIAVCIFRAQIFGFILIPDNIFIAMLCFALTAASILCIYISVGEIFTVHGNRAAKKKKSQGHSKLSSKDNTRLRH